ncbi:MAG: RidA family protein [bacterium]|nr:RidA family protein [bacterium]
MGDAYGSGGGGPIFTAKSAHTQFLFSDLAPEPGYYSQCVLKDCGAFWLAHLAGQTGNVPGIPGEPVIYGGIGPQTTQALKNIAAILKDAGGSITDVSKYRVILKDTEPLGISLTNAREAFGKAYAEFLAKYGISKENGNLPARTLFWAVEVPLEAPNEDTLIEIEVDPVVIRKS